MARTAEQTARAAETTFTNRVGMCLMECRTWANIPPRYPDASTAWRHANNRRLDRQPPRGAMTYWTGGSRGYGHIAVGLGDGLVRSTDADGAGRCATRNLAWFDVHWPSLDYAGWAWNVNEVEIPHEEEPELTEKEWDRMRELVEREVAQAVAANNDNVVKAVWDKMIEVTKPDGKKDDKSTKQVLRETWQRVAKM